MSVDEHTLILLREYIEHVDMMRSGQFTTGELHTLDSERILLHDRLCELLGLDRSVDMYRRAQAILMYARGVGLL
jgi:hypothetical protein